MFCHTNSVALQINTKRVQVSIDWPTFTCLWSSSAHFRIREDDYANESLHPALKILRPTCQMRSCMSQAESWCTPVSLLQWDLSKGSAERSCSFQQHWPFIYLPCPPFLWCIIPLTSRGGNAWASPSERKRPRETLPHLMCCFPQLTIAAHAKCLCFLFWETFKLHLNNTGVHVYDDMAPVVRHACFTKMCLTALIE